MMKRKIPGSCVGVLLAFFLYAELVYAAAPGLSRTSPSSSSITIAVGDSATFAANGTDVDANLSGTEWYGIPENPAVPMVQYVSEVGGTGSSADFLLNTTFNSAGSYTISVVAFDSSSTYSSAIEWNITVNPDIPVPGYRAMYVDQFDSILGNPYKETALLKFAQNNNFNELALYRLHSVPPANSSNLENFIVRAKNEFEIQEIKAIGALETDFDRIQTFNNSVSAGAKFTGLVLEYEYWNNSPKDIDRYIELLSYMRLIADIQALSVDTYMGWLTPGNELTEAQRIANVTDSVYLHCYRADAADTYNYCKERMYWFSQAKPGIAVRPIFSAEWRPIETCEVPHVPGDGNMCFMGEWFSNNNIEFAESIFTGSFEGDSPVWASDLVVNSFQYFAYTHLAAAIPSAPIVEPLTPGESSISLVDGDNQQFTVFAQDWNQDILGVRWYVNNVLQQTQTVDEVSGTGSSTTFSRTEGFSNGGAFIIRADVFDSEQLIGTVAWLVDVVAHTLSISSSPSAMTNPVASGASTNLRVAANDSQGHTLNYNWAASCPGLGSNGRFSSATAQNPGWIAPANSTDRTQHCILSVAVDDGAGGLSDTGAVSVSVSAGIQTPSVIGFADSVSSIAENGGIVYLTVTRSGGTRGHSTRELRHCGRYCVGRHRLPISEWHVDLCRW